jgi:hypothetical protein
MDMDGGSEEIIDCVTEYGQCGQPGVYGTLGTSAMGNIPGSRTGAATWVDSGGNFWLFGGNGYDSNFVFGDLNDLWKFDPSTNEWAWISGTNSIQCIGLDGADGFQGDYCGQLGVYGTLGVPSAGNVPGGRSPTSNWMDASGNLWLFGGVGLDASGSYLGGINDLWVFNPSTSEWAWMGGYADTGGCVGVSLAVICGGTPGVYGTLETPAVGNIPGNRTNAVSWTDSGGNFWLFSGWGTADIEFESLFLNDVWEYQPSAAMLPPAVMPVFNPPPGTYATGTQTTLSNGMANANFFYTTDGTTPTAASTPYTGPFTIPASGIVKAIATSPGYPDSGVAAASYVIEAVTAAPTFSIPSGTYSSAQTVTLSDFTSGASIFFSTDGVTSNPYTGPITVSSTETVLAIATAPGYITSPVRSATYTINLPPPDFTLAASPSSLTATPGSSATTTVSVTPANGFNSAVSFACSGLPSGASCSFSPATVTPPSTTSTTLTVATSTTTAAFHRNGNPLIPGAALAGVLCCLSWRKRRNLQLMLLLAVAFAGIGLVSGCGSGGGGGGSGPPPPTSYTVTVTATSGPLQQTATFTLTVN